MFDARVEAAELRQIVQGFVPEACEHRLQAGCDGIDINQKPVVVQGVAGQAPFDAVGVGMGVILRSEIPTDQIMLCNELSLHGDGVHNGSLRINCRR